ncbi:MAG: hypothetical protein ABI723_18935 [Bacteroidia bacterium]
MKKKYPFQFLIIIKNCIVACGIICTLLFLNSCTECGCTDQAALNYNSTADKNDGSCQYCDSVLNQYTTKTVLVKDFHSASPHYNEVVAKFVFSQDSLRYDDQICGDNTCLIYLHIESQVNQEMEFSYLITSANPLNLNNTRHIIIPANASYDADTVATHGSNPCYNLNSSSIGVNIVNSYIVYH